MKLPISKATIRAIAQGVHLQELKEQSDMLPEAKRAIEIADAHLRSAPARKRMLLALDIQKAIAECSQAVALEAVRAALEARDRMAGAQQR